MTKKKEKLYLIEEDISNYYELENGWWVYCGLKRDRSIKRGRSRVHAQKAKSDPKLCPECDYVWAREYCSTTKTTNSILLTNFPKYKLEKQVCYFCKPETERQKKK